MVNDEPDEGGDAPQGAPWVDDAAEVATNLLTTAANQLGGSTAGAYATAASPLVRRAFSTIGTHWQKLTTRTGQRVLEEAEAAGVPPDVIEERVAADDRLLLLAGTAIEAGSRTVNEDKLRGLGRSLAAAVSDDALVDPSALAIAALADMEAPHLKVLRHVAEEHVVAASVRKDRQVWRRDALAAALPEVADVIGPVLATLSRHGAVVEQDQTAKSIEKLEKDRRDDNQRAARSGFRYTGTPRYAPLPSLWLVTEFGLHLLELVRAAAAEDAASEAGTVEEGDAGA